MYKNALPPGRAFSLLQLYCQGRFQHLTALCIMIAYLDRNSKKMIKTFPNIKVEDIDNNQIYLDSLLKDIQPYYLKVYDKKP